MSVTGLDPSVNLTTFFMLGIIVLVITNMHFGISNATMLMPLREWIPGLQGLDTLVGLSLAIYFFQKYWSSIGWLTTFVFVFGFIWLIS
ncbi:MAG: hypothetical protein AABY04_02335 [Candidatus Micrarchaeota archaeon]